jgi:Ca2+-binding RTX toxin-like protein
MMPLESRRMQAANPYTVYAAGSWSETTLSEASGGRYLLEYRSSNAPLTRLYLAGSTDLLIVQGGSGADRLTNNTRVSTLFFGRDGNDVAIGGSSSDTLIGGAGSDYLDGRGGSDILVGGYATTSGQRRDAWSDSLIGGAGNDTLYGERGDQLNGGAGSNLHLLD